MITKSQANNLPNTIGLYLFKNNKTINYIGKSVNIKARILSHLENAKLDNKERLIIKNSNKIGTIITESEFKALILEAKLIRQLQPKYNSIWKDDKSPLYIKITAKDEFPKVGLVRKESDKQNLYFGYIHRKYFLFFVQIVLPFLCLPLLRIKTVRNLRDNSFLCLLSDKWFVRALIKNIYYLIPYYIFSKVLIPNKCIPFFMTTVKASVKATL